MNKTIKFHIPGTKSLANRALILASLAKGKSILRNMPKGDDVNYMRKSLEKIQQKKSNYFYIGNAGTAARFLTALLCLIPGEKILDGDNRMRKRPIKNLVDGLRQLGTVITYQKKNGFLPLKIESEKLIGGKVKIKADKSSQFISALLMIAPYAAKPMEIEIIGKITSRPYIELTIDLMKKFGVKVKKTQKGYSIRSQQYRAIDYKIESDCAAASYFAGMGMLHGKKILFQISKETKQGEYGFFSALKKIKKGSGRIIDCGDFPDSSITLAVLAAIAKGKTTLNNIGNLAIKETDRLAALKKELNRLGIEVKKTKNSLKITGNPDLKIPKPVKIKTYNDHRMAMSFAVLKSRFPNIQIENPSCVKKSYPDFWKDYRKFLVKIGKNIVLTGMRGSGKSTLGKLFTKKLNYQFIDIDEQIQKVTQCGVAEYIEKKGIARFRLMEKAVIKKVSQKNRAVIATGGGAILDEENEKFLKKNGWIIYLDCPVSLLMKRLKRDPKKELRPSLTGMPPEKELKELYKQRKKRYEESADLIINPDEANAKKILEKIFQ